MPDLDVTFLLSDPDFATTFDVLPQTQSVNTYGEALNTGQLVTGVVGVVTALDDLNLQRVPEGQLQKGAIQIYTMRLLDAGGQGRTADTIFWPSGADDAYVVVDVSDWSQFGAGWVMAIASRIQVSAP